MHERLRRWLYRSPPLTALLLRDWSIGVFTAVSPLRPQPAANVANPVLTSRTSPSSGTAFVADPFMVRDSSQYWMFFEAMRARTGRGEIWLARSANGLEWAWAGPVLSEPFHLSFPCVIADRSDYWMVPESRGARSVRLYAAGDFPRRWTAVRDLLRGSFVDPSLVRYEDRWWLFVTSGGRLHLFHAREVHGPWTEHAKSPVVSDPAISRAAGRPIAFDGRLVRLAQSPGRSRIRAFDVVELSPAAYLEREAPESPIALRREAWNGGGIHHLDACPLPDGRWLVAIDGRLTRSAPSSASP